MLNILMDYFIRLGYSLARMSWAQGISKSRWEHSYGILEPLTIRDVGRGGELPVPALLTQPRVKT